MGAWLLEDKSLRVLAASEWALRVDSSYFVFGRVYNT